MSRLASRRAMNSSARVSRPINQVRSTPLNYSLQFSLTLTEAPDLYVPPTLKPMVLMMPRSPKYSYHSVLSHSSRPASHSQCPALATGSSQPSELSMFFSNTANGAESQVFDRSDLAEPSMLLSSTSSQADFQEHDQSQLLEPATLLSSIASQYIDNIAVDEAPSVTSAQTSKPLSFAMQRFLAEPLHNIQRGLTHGVHSQAGTSVLDEGSGLSRICGAPGAGRERPKKGAEEVFKDCKKVVKNGKGVGKASKKKLCQCWRGWLNSSQQRRRSVEDTAAKMGDIKALFDNMRV